MGLIIYYEWFFGDKNEKGRGAKTRVTVSQLAKYCGVTRQAVHSNPMLPYTEKKIKNVVRREYDPQNVEIVNYCAAHGKLAYEEGGGVGKQPPVSVPTAREGEGSPRKKRGRPPKSRPVAPAQEGGSREIPMPILGAADISEMSVLDLDKLKTIRQIEGLEQKNKTDKLLYDEMRGKLIGQDVVKYYFSGYLDRINLEIMNAGGMLGPRLADIIKSEINKGTPLETLAEQLIGLVKDVNTAIVKDAHASQRKELEEWMREKKKNA